MCVIVHTTGQIKYLVSCILYQTGIFLTALQEYTSWQEKYMWIPLLILDNKMSSHYNLRSSSQLLIQRPPMEMCFQPLRTSAECDIHEKWSIPSVHLIPASPFTMLQNPINPDQ